MNSLPFETLLAGVEDGMIVTDRAHRIVYVNAAVEKLTGYSSRELIGRSPRLFQGADTCPRARNLIRERLARARPVSLRIMNYAKDGRPYWAGLRISPVSEKGSSEISHYVAFHRDETEEQCEHDSMRALAFSDPLTGIPNRRRFLDEAERLVSEARRYRRPLSFIVADIDGFKQLNDEHGHDCGDRVLEDVVARAQPLLRKPDLFARLGGDEFVIALPETALSKAVAVAERLRRRISESALTDPAVRVAASFGVTMLGLSAFETLQTCLKRADQALYEAKSSGRNTIGVKNADEGDHSRFDDGAVNISTPCQRPKPRAVHPKVTFSESPVIEG